MRKNTLIFVGPSLFGVNYNHRPDEVWLPPARQGDVLKNYLLHLPRQIVLIDGYLRQDFSVWHKELVYLMLDGCKFIGASSIGAIRATELWRYGAIGIGKIFEAYRDGKTEDDSWVLLEFHPQTFKPFREPPCGSEQKRLDAIEAIEYARTNKDKPKCGFDKSAITPFLAMTIDRILHEEYLVHG